MGWGGGKPGGGRRSRGGRGGEAVAVEADGSACAGGRPEEEEEQCASGLSWKTSCLSRKTTADPLDLDPTVQIESTCKRTIQSD